MMRSKTVVVVMFGDQVVGYHTGKFRTTDGVTVPVVTDDPRLAKRYGIRRHGRFGFDDAVDAVRNRSGGKLSAKFTTINYEDGDHDEP